MTQGSKQNALVDYGRFAASIGIVLFHSKLPGASIGLAALPLFTIFFCYFGIVSNRKATFEDSISERNARLMVPWYFWCAVYGAAKLAEVLVSGRPLQSEFSWFMLGTGTSIHLWFLPFAFLLSLVQYWFVWPYRLSPNTFTVLSVVFFGLSLACFSIGPETQLAPPWAQWLYVIPPAIFGILLALVRGSRSKLVIVAGLAASVAGTALLFQWTHGLLQFAVSAAVAAPLLLNYLPSTALSSALGRATMGVYLVHPLVFSLVSRVTGESMSSVALLLVVIVSSTGIALLAQLHSLSRRFV